MVKLFRRFRRTQEEPAGGDDASEAQEVREEY